MKQNKQEIWREIIGYEGYYEASNLGRMRSLDRWVIFKDGRKRFHKGRIIEGTDNGLGYKQVTLSRDNKAQTFYVHQLIAVTFLNHIPNGNTLVVDHIDGDSTNDNVDNLRIVTQRQNVSTCFRKDRNTFTSDFAGVYYHKQNNKWIAKIQLKNNITHLGSFENEIDASDAYQKALAKINDGTFDPENYKPKFSSNFKGITFHKASRKWMARPTINGKQVYLGRFENELEAHQAILEFEAIQPILI